MTDPLAHLSISYRTREAFARLAEQRQLAPETLLRILVETFISAHAVGTSVMDRPPEQRIAEALAHRVRTHGDQTRGQAWRSLSYRDRQRGRDVFDAAIELGEQQRLFGLDHTSGVLAAATHPPC